MFDDRTPIYRQIAEQIRLEILSGQLEEDEKVMSTNQYATFYRINPATAQKAFQSLVDDGVLYKQRGIGMFVVRGAREQLQREHRDRFFVEVLEPMLSEARTIGIPESDLIEYISGNYKNEESQ